jgi:transposase
MKLTINQYNQIKEYLPIQRGNVQIDNYLLLNALFYILENGCKWRALPEKYGNWATVYKRINRWAKSGVLERIFKTLQQKRVLKAKVSFVALDSTCCKVHPNGCGALKKTECNLLEKQKEDGIPNFIWYPVMIKL